MKQVGSYLVRLTTIYFAITISAVMCELATFNDGDTDRIISAVHSINKVSPFTAKDSQNDTTTSINTIGDYTYYIVNTNFKSRNDLQEKVQNKNYVPNSSFKFGKSNVRDLTKENSESKQAKKSLSDSQKAPRLIVLSSIKNNNIANLNFPDIGNLSASSFLNVTKALNKQTTDADDYDELTNQISHEMTNQISPSAFDELTMIPFIRFNFSTDLLLIGDTNISMMHELSNSSLRTGTGSYPVLFPDWVVWAWTCILLCLLVAGLIGNSLVMAVVARTRDLRSSTNLLLVNLAGADILVLLVPLPTALTELHTRPETWVLGKAMCKAVPFVEWTVSHASVLTILVISLERYYAICRPLRASYTCTRIRALTCIALIWMAALLISLPIFFLSQFAFVRYKGETILMPSCFTDMSSWWGKGYYTGMVALLFFLPLTLLMVLYLLIGRRLMRDSTSAGNFQIRKPEPPNIRARKQVVVMIATVTVFFFVCLLPFRVFSLYIIWDEGSGKSIGPTPFYSLLYASRILLYLNSSINPILYSLTSSKFRDAFIKIVNREPPSSRGLSRHSTFTTTGNSISNGRSASNLFDPFIGTPNGSLKVLNLAKYGRQWSLDTLPSNTRKNLSQYGRQSSFTAPNICGWNNGKACSQIHGNPDSKGVFIVKEEKTKILTSFQEPKLPCVQEHSFLGETTVLDIKDDQFTSETEDDPTVLPLNIGV